MDTNDSRQRFEQATTFFKEGRYSEALNLLDSLDLQFPNQKNVMIPRALCLEQLGRPQEALEICEEVLALFDDRRAPALKARLDAALQPAGTSLADLTLETQRPAPVAIEEASSKAWIKWVLIGGGVLVIGLLLSLPLIMGTEMPTKPAASGDAVATTTNVNAAATLFAVLFFVGACVLEVLITYTVLNFMGKLKHDELFGNVVDIVVILLICGLVGIIPIIGWGIGIAIFSSHYEMSCGEILIYLIVSGLLGLVAFFLLFLVFGASLGGLAAFAT